MNKISAQQKAQMMVGIIYNRLFVVSVTEKIGNLYYINCLCSCGNALITRAYNVANGNTKSCGCLNKESHNKITSNQSKLAKDRALLEIGNKINRLTILSVSDIVTDGHIYVNCLCDCGSTNVLTTISSIRSGKTTSCGCRQKEVIKENYKKSVPARIISGDVQKDPKLSSAKKIYRDTYKDGDLSFEDFLLLSRQNCFYCDAVPFNKTNLYSYGKMKDISDPERVINGWFIYNGLDRIDNNQGHNKDNVITCCIDCNKAKMQRTHIQFLSWIKRIYDKHIK